MWLSQRSESSEIMDQGPEFYTEQEYKKCLYQLDRIGRYLGGDRATFHAFRKLHSPIETILDVGCGSGLFTMRLAKDNPQAQVLGIDTSFDAIQYAKTNLKSPSHLKNIQFSVTEPKLKYPSNSFDIITSTLVCHHLSDQDFIQFLKDAYLMSKKYVILNDLHRHILAYVGFSCLAPILFSNRLTRHDGLVSIKKGFKKSELLKFLQAAGIPLQNCSITWHWAFRWIILINTMNK